MGYSALPAYERFALKVDERIRRYGREYPVPPHVGDLLTLDHFATQVTVAAVHDDGTVSLRPYEPSGE
jgi:hypothetical protein